jgi:ABC-type branched-subunit amino acid transport system substrate-binding protein
MTPVSTSSRGRFIGSAAAASAVAFGSPAILSAQSKEIVIGLNVPQSGPYSEQGKDQLRAYNLAIDEINKSGGIMGLKVKTSVGDDQTTAGVARDNAPS